MTQILSGKTALVLGVVNQHSLAWSIVKSLQQAGARVIFSYERPDHESKMHHLVSSWTPEEQTPSVPVRYFPCDVDHEHQIENLFGQVAHAFQNQLDIMVHSLAFASSRSFREPLMNCSKQDYAQAQAISAYSLLPLVKHAHPLMKNRSASILALSYLGSSKVRSRPYLKVPNPNPTILIQKTPKTLKP